ncbi:hypothetical protein [Mesorhizobium sp. ES1-1]|uniref:hypothetical protein n=1 Tax=Mesorhizobium sp. ES1-1 TaxID=2876629 RepID=UPI001CCF48A7|nr:hypothetical protein [Mesorhizobium sp. ES1-1]MBZ9675359.1 hypothetical protein [Mesorhizobium sp. ES1-1]
MIDIVIVMGGRYTLRCGDSGRSRLAKSWVAGDLLMAPQFGVPVPVAQSDLDFGKTGMHKQNPKRVPIGRHAPAAGGNAALPLPVATSDTRFLMLFLHRVKARKPFWKRNLV